MPPETAIAERPARSNPIVPIQQALDRRLPALEAFLPSDQLRQRFMRIVYQAVQKNDALLECTPESIAAAAVEAAMYGLEPSGAAGGAHLVPFKDRKTGKTEAQLIVDYRGQLQLARDSERVEDAFAELVYQADHFVWDAANQKIEHIPNLEVPRGAPFDEANPVTWAYAVVVHKSGYRRPVPMTRGEVEQVRSISRAANGPAWTNHWGEMAKKTVMHRALKTAPLRPGAKAILERDPDFTFEPAQATVEPVDAAPRGALADRLRQRRQLATSAADEQPASAGEGAPVAAPGGEADASRASASPDSDAGAEGAPAAPATAQAASVPTGGAPASAPGDEADFGQAPDATPPPNRLVVSLQERAQMATGSSEAGSATSAQRTQLKAVFRPIGAKGTQRVLTEAFGLSDPTLISEAQAAAILDAAAVEGFEADLVALVAGLAEGGK